MDKPVVEQMKFKISPWKHQAEAIERAAPLNQFALFFSMGAGKTGTTINILRWKYATNGRLLKTLILGPPIILENWKREFAMHSNIPEKDVQVIYHGGVSTKKIEALQRVAFDASGVPVPKILITNYQTLLNKEVMALLTAWAPEAVVVDECQRVKSRSAKTTQNVLKLTDQARYRYILTGTPVLNSLMDLYSQFRILDKGMTFGTNFFKFRNTYFVDRNSGMPAGRYFPKWEPVKEAEKRITEKIAPISARVKKEECMDLPPLIKQVVYVEMGKEQKKMYEEMRKNFITFMDGKAVTAELAMTKALRLQQIASGYVMTEDGDEITLKENPRKDALHELLEDICIEAGEKVLVWSCFRENYKQIKEVCAALKLEYVEVHGDVSPKTRFESVDKFNQDPNTKVFIGHPGSGGVGINLVAASYSIFFTRNFNLEFDLQAESRNHRGGSEIHAKITRIDLVAQGTIDEVIQTKLAQKEAIGEAVLRNIAKELKEKWNK